MFSRGVTGNDDDDMAVPLFGLLPLVADLTVGGDR